MILAAVVFVAMALMDTAAACKILLLSHGHPWLSGLAEAVNDLGGVLSYGIGGAALLRYGASPTTGVILSSLCCASVLGTRLGALVSDHLPGGNQ